jgi:hypothetical protein
MRPVLPLVAVSCALLSAASVNAQGTSAPTTAQAAPDPVRTIVSRLDLERYKATLRGLQQFGDRRQGTSRNRAAVDWIEAQLKSYGCTNTERLTYQFTGRQVQNDSTRRVDSLVRVAQGLPPLPARAQRSFTPVATTDSAGLRYDRAGNIIKGNVAPTSVNMNPLLQPDTALRRIDAEPDTPGERQEVYCTKIGATHPEEMYIVGGHMDGHGYGAALNDDGSGTALVMELARIFNAPDVTTDRSIRFILWNNEETGLNGSRAYVAQRQALQGVENPKGSGRYPEPKWVGMIQHDMMMWDHGMPGPDGKVSPVQRREADVNVEFAGASKFADESQKLAWFFRKNNDRYATNYPAAVGDRMSNTDSDPFKDLCPTISVRENERLAQTGTGWNPTWHQPIDVYSTFSDKDFLLGLNAAQTTLSAVAQLAGARLR